MYNLKPYQLHMDHHVPVATTWKSQFDYPYSSVSVINNTNDFITALSTSSIAYLMTTDVQIAGTYTLTGIALIGVLNGVAIVPTNPNLVYVGINTNAQPSIIFMTGSGVYDPTFQYYVTKKRNVYFNVNSIFDTVENVVVGFLKFKMYGINTLNAMIVGSILIGSCTTSLIESVGLCVCNAQISTDDETNIGGFVGSATDSTINRCELIVGGNYFNVLTTNQIGTCGMFIGSLYSLTIGSSMYGCSVVVRGCALVQVGCINAVGSCGSIGGFIGYSEGTISYCSLDVGGNGYVGVGILLGKRSGIGVGTTGSFGALGNPYGYYAGGFCGYSICVLDTCSVKFTSNEYVVIGADVYAGVGVDLDAWNVGRIGLSDREVGVGGFVGFIERRAPVNVVFPVVGVKNCGVLGVGGAGGPIVIGVKIVLDGSITNSFVGVTQGGGITGIGGFYGISLGVDIIYKCGVEMCCASIVGLDIKVKEAAGTVVGNMGTHRVTMDGIGGFGGTTSCYSLVLTLHTVSIRKCSVKYENCIVGMCIGVGDLLGNVIGCMAVDTVLIDDDSKGVAGIGGFFGLLRAFDAITNVNVVVEDCGGVYGYVSGSVGIQVCGGNSGSLVATIGATPASFNMILRLYEGAGIGGFGGMGASSTGMVLRRCVCSFEKLAGIIGTGIKGLGGGGSGTILESGIGGFWGEIQGTMGSFSLDNSDGCDLGNQVLSYVAIPQTVTHVMRYVGYFL